MEYIEVPNEKTYIWAQIQTWQYLFPSLKDFICRIANKCRKGSRKDLAWCRTERAPLGYQLVRPLHTGNEREAQNTQSVARRQVSGTLVQQSVLRTGGFSLIPIRKLHFIFHMVPIRTPFKGSKKITSPKTFWRLSLSLRVEPKVLSTASRSMWSGPRYLCDRGS